MEILTSYNQIDSVKSRIIIEGKKELMLVTGITVAG